MSGFPSGGLRPADRRKSDPEFDFPRDYEPRVTVGLLLRIGSLLLVALGLAVTASLLYGAPR